MTPATALAVAALAAPPAAGPASVAQGPFVGHVTPESVSIWARGSAVGPYVLNVAEPGAKPWLTATARARADDDQCMTFTISGLAPQTTYEYAVTPAGLGLAGAEVRTFVTAPPDDAAVRVKIAFGSCATEGAGPQLVWDRIGAVGADVVVLLGDTPYIDTTSLDVQRQRYRAFASVAAMGQVLGHTPWYGTWDDHDFGLNDTDGNLPGKESSRRAFVEYHANPSYGDGQSGIYTRFRRGPVEVFLLDTRWFAATGPAPVDAGHPTLLGPGQWHWLLRGLQASDATFKVLASGMIWNKAVRPSKTDHWATYQRERNALFRFIGEAGITGVVLVGGDIHRSRVVRHAVAATAGYDLTELITSPMHESIIATANAPHPGLVWDAGEPNSFLLLDIDSTVQPASLTARFLNAAGDVLHEETLDAGQLTAGGP